MRTRLVVGVLSALLALGGTFVPGQNIVADHTVVADYDKIPSVYLDQVKAMMIDLAGESHSGAYPAGLRLLADADPRLAVNTTWWLYSTEPKNALWATNCRCDSTGTSFGGAGEATFYTSVDAVNGREDANRDGVFNAVDLAYVQARVAGLMTPKP